MKDDKPTDRRVLALTKYDGLAASTRQRLLQFVPSLNAAGFSLELNSLFDAGYMQRLQQGLSHPLSSIAGSYLKRLQTLLFEERGALTWLHYEAFPYLPSPFEMLAAKQSAPLVIDFDDAIFHQYDSHRQALVRAALGKKLQPLMARARICTVGNEYLAAYARQFCADVRIIPTVLDTDHFKPAINAKKDSLVVGWIGSPSTWRYVEPLSDRLQAMLKDKGATMRVVGAGAKVRQRDGFSFVDWEEEREVSEIQGFDVGVMPLPDENWARGKCGYKLIQYMACGVPVVASSVGANKAIVTPGINGHLADNEVDFVDAIADLIDNTETRAKMGAAGRTHIVENYSLRRWQGDVVAAFEDAVRS